MEWRAADAAQWITVPREEDDKYSRGVLGVATGSARYPGAAVIGVDAALHAGIGMVRYLGPEAVGRLVLERRPEAVLEPAGAPGRAHAWVLGSGTEAGTQESFAPSEAMACILDAGAIGAARAGSAPTIVTPHAGELARLLATTRAQVEADPVGSARRASAQLDAVVLLKGSTTRVVLGERVVAVRAATPWLATAGAGDALAGVLGALVASYAARSRSASRSDRPSGSNGSANATGAPLDLDALVSLGATAALVHATAARIAARTEPDGSGGGPFTILDLNAALPEAIRRILRV